MSKKKPELDGRFPGVEPIPQSDHPNQAATDKLDDLVLGILGEVDEAHPEPETENYDKLRKK